MATKLLKLVFVTAIVQGVKLTLNSGHKKGSSESDPKTSEAGKKECRPKKQNGGSPSSSSDSACGGCNDEGAGLAEECCNSHDDLCVWTDVSRRSSSSNDDKVIVTVTQYDLNNFDSDKVVFQKLDGSGASDKEILDARRSNNTNPTLYKEVPKMREATADDVNDGKKLRKADGTLVTKTEVVGANASNTKLYTTSEETTKKSGSSSSNKDYEYAVVTRTEIRKVDENDNNLVKIDGTPATKEDVRKAKKDPTFVLYTVRPADPELEKGIFRLIREIGTGNQGIQEEVKQGTEEQVKQAISDVLKSNASAEDIKSELNERFKLPEGAQIQTEHIQTLLDQRKLQTFVQPFVGCWHRVGGNEGNIHVFDGPAPIVVLEDMKGSFHKPNLIKLVDESIVVNPIPLRNQRSRRGLTTPLTFDMAKKIVLIGTEGQELVRCQTPSLPQDAKKKLCGKNNKTPAFFWHIFKYLSMEDTYCALSKHSDAKTPRETMKDHVVTELKERILSLMETRRTDVQDRVRRLIERMQKQKKLEDDQIDLNDENYPETSETGSLTEVEIDVTEADRLLVMQKAIHMKVPFEYGTKKMASVEFRMQSMKVQSDNGSVDYLDFFGVSLSVPVDSDEELDDINTQTDAQKPQNPVDNLVNQIKSLNLEVEKPNVVHRYQCESLRAEAELAAEEGRELEEMEKKLLEGCAPGSNVQILRRVLFLLSKDITDYSDEDRVSLEIKNDVHADVPRGVAKMIGAVSARKEYDENGHDVRTEIFRFRYDSPAFGLSASDYQEYLPDIQNWLLQMHLDIINEKGQPMLPDPLPVACLQDRSRCEFPKMAIGFLHRYLGIEHPKESNIPGLDNDQRQWIMNLANFAKDLGVDDMALFLEAWLKSLRPFDPTNP